MSPSLAVFCRRLSLAVPLALVPAAASASSPEAWDVFRRDVETACRSASAQSHPGARIVVDPFGSQNYGIAFLRTGEENGESGQAVCIYDKRTGAAEIGGEMALVNAVPELLPDPGTTASLPAAPAEPQPAEIPAVSTFAEPLAERFAPDASVAAENRESLATPAAAVAVAPPLFSGACDAACETSLSALAEADRADILALPGRMARALEAHAGTTLSEGPAAARETLLALVAAAERGETGDGARALTEEAAGTRACTLYYFGYGNEASRTVGRHQCSVSAAPDGTLTVEKTSGERLAAAIRPLTPGFSAFVGRTFEAGASVQAYDAQSPDGTDGTGNAVGLAAADGGRILLASSQMRRFEADGDFFWVLALDPA